MEIVIGKSGKTNSKKNLVVLVIILIMIGRA